MAIKKLIPTDLLFVIIIALLADIFVMLPSLHINVLKIIIGLPILLFLPGYTLISALFPGKYDLDTIERLSLSLGLSIAIVPLVGLVLNYTSWGIRLIPVMASLVIFIVIMAMIAAYRRQDSGEYAYTVEFAGIYRSARSLIKVKHESRLDLIITVALVFSILLSTVVFVYALVSPEQGEKFTEFYILGPQGTADNYNTQLVRGESMDVTLGIINREYVPATYSVVVKLGNETIDTQDRLQQITLEPNEKWEQNISFTPDITGENKLQFLLYKDNNNTGAYRDLHLWVNIRDNI